jgi:putative DNA methylase
MSDVRLIERWLPIAALGEESMRERRSLSALPAVYYLHVWWARRPLVASRAAILASFMHSLGIHGDPGHTKRLIERSKRTGEDLGLNPYGYDRAFKYQPSAAEKDWLLKTSRGRTILDPTAGGGSIPFEAARLGFDVFANDLNPVASLIERATD